MIYVRWKQGEPRRIRDLPPMAADHPAADLPCLCCNYPAALPGIPITLVAVGPVDDEGRERYAAGRWCNAGTVIAHSSCLDSTSDAELEGLVAELVVTAPTPTED